MPYVTVAIENDAAIDIHYEDRGSGHPIVLINGYPLDGSSWERQERELLANRYRVITTTAAALAGRVSRASGMTTTPSPVI